MATVPAVSAAKNDKQGNDDEVPAWELASVVALLGGSCDSLANS